MSIKLLVVSRILLSSFGLSENQPQGSFFGACKIGSHEQPNMRRQLPNHILYWKFDDVSINNRNVLILNINRNAELFSDLEKH
jgi:hypothetical protein